MPFVRADLETCPYDQSHRISHAKITNHLIKCRRNNEPQSRELVLCPHNGGHFVPKPEFEFHVAKCVKRVSWVTLN